jgi:hypothetical protein
MENFAVFFIGVLVGLIIAFILVTILYSTRTFVFSGCTTSNRTCRASDYYNIPGRALAEGASIGDILFINPEGQLIYRRVPKNVCRPGENQDIVIPHPQYCTFTFENGLSLEARNAGLGSNVYTLVNGLNIDITIARNCTPVSSSLGTVVSGTPILRWDPANISEIAN